MHGSMAAEVVERGSGQGAGRPVAYAPLKVSGVLRQGVEGEGPWHWVLNPYEGCEFGCGAARPLRVPAPGRAGGPGTQGA